MLVTASRSAAVCFCISWILFLMILRSSRSIAFLFHLHVLSPLPNALIPLVVHQRRHERLQDVAVASPFASVLWLGLVHPSIVGMLQTACPFLHVSLLVSLAVALLLVLVVLVALRAGRFLMSQFPYLL